VTVTVYATGDVVTEVFTVKVEVPEPPVIEAGTNVHVGLPVPTGMMLPHDRFTVPVKPFVAAMVTVEVDGFPATTEAGERAVAAIVKSGTGVTVRLTVVSWVKDPKAPVTVTVEVATGVAAVVAIVRTEFTAVAPSVTVGGAKAQLVPSGRPEQVSVTGLLKPLIALTETVYVAGLPATTVALGGVALMPKSRTVPACRNATACMTQLAKFESWTAVAPRRPAAGPTRCSTLILPPGVVVTVV